MIGAVSRTNSYQEPRAAPKSVLLTFASSMPDRAEPIRLSMALAGKVWVERAVSEAEEGDGGTAESPFGELPTLMVGASGSRDAIVVAPCDAILRFVQREFLGRLSPAQQTRFDTLLPCALLIRDRFLVLVYEAHLTGDATQVFYEKCVDPASAHGRNNGAHLAYIEACLERWGGAGSWAAGTPEVSAVDALVAELFHSLTRESVALHFAASPRDHYPLLAKLHDGFYALPGVREYVEQKSKDTAHSGAPVV